MRVMFLGTGAAEGLPALFCDCPVCTEARRRGGPDRRTRCSVLIDDTIKIDLPPDTLAHVHAYPDICLAKLQHLLFTHSHDDHFAVRELQYLSPNFAPSRRAPLHIYATSGVIEQIRPVMSGFFEEAPLRLSAVTPFEEFRVGHLLATSIVANHKADELCLNFLLRDPDTGKTLLYGCDTGWWGSETWEFLAQRRGGGGGGSAGAIDTVILECGKGASDNGYTGHLNIEECVQVRQKLIDDGALARADVPFYLTHIAHTGLLLHREMTEAVAPYGMRVAYDGLRIDI